MIKKTVQYRNADNDPVQQDLYFHLDKADVLGELSVIDRFEAFQKRIEGDKRELTTAEKQEMVDLIEVFARLSYGLRTQNGGFRKNREIWLEFREGLAWGAFWWPIFSQPEEFQAFMTGVLPDDLREEARKQIEQMPGQEALSFDNGLPPIPQPEDTPAPTLKSLDSMTPDELRARLAQLEGK